MYVCSSPCCVKGFADRLQIIVGHQTSTPSSHLQACNQLLNLRQNAGVTCPGDETSYTMVIQAVREMLLSLVTLLIRM